MPKPLDFYFDFSSPYSYLASEKIEELAARHGRTVQFRPMLLGVAFRASGQKPLTEVPLKGDYSRRDFARSARYHGVAFRMPEPFPIGTVDAARTVVWLQQSDPERIPAFVHAGYRAFFVHGRNLSDRSVLAEVVRESGIDPEAAMAAIAGAPVKEALRAQVEEAIALGVFGAPFIMVDGEPFWGHDRFPQIERWLAQGPF